MRIGTGLTYLISVKGLRVLSCIATGKCCLFRKDIYGLACWQRPFSWPRDIPELGM